MMRQIAAFWKSGPIGKLILIAGGAGGALVLLVVCCVVALVIVPSRPITQALQPPNLQPVVVEESNEQAFEPTKAPPTPRPTQTPRPTEAPTSTPEPSATPESPATALPVIPAESAAYMRRVGDFGSTMGKTFSEIAKLLQAPDLTSTDWKIELAAQIVMLQEAHQELLDLEDIPADMADIHSERAQQLVRRGHRHVASVADS
jgi:hypothetical protein